MKRRGLSTFLSDHGQVVRRRAVSAWWHSLRHGAQWGKWCVLVLALGGCAERVNAARRDGLSPDAQASDANDERVATANDGGAEPQAADASSEPGADACPAELHTSATVESPVSCIDLVVPCNLPPACTFKLVVDIGPPPWVPPASCPQCVATESYDSAVCEGGQVQIAAPASPYTPNFCCECAPQPEAGE